MQIIDAKFLPKDVSIRTQGGLPDVLYIHLIKKELIYFELCLQDSTKSDEKSGGRKVRDSRL